MLGSETMQSEHYEDANYWANKLSFVELNLYYFESNKKYISHDCPPNTNFNSKMNALKKWIIEKVNNAHSYKIFSKWLNEELLPIDEIKSMKLLTPEYKFSLIKHPHISGSDARSLDELTYYFINALPLNKKERIELLSKESSQYCESDTVKRLGFVIDSYELLEWSLKWIEKTEPKHYFNLLKNKWLLGLEDIQTLSSKTILSHYFDSFFLSQPAQVHMEYQRKDYSQYNRAYPFIDELGEEEVNKLLPDNKPSVKVQPEVCLEADKKLHFITIFKHAYQKRKSRIKQSKETKLYSFTMNKSLEKKLNHICAIEGMKKSEMVERLINEAFFSVSNTKRVFQDTSGIQYRVKPKQ